MGDERERRRLAVASSLSARLAPLFEPDEIARVTVEELTEAYDCDSASIMRRDNDGYLHPVAGAAAACGRSRRRRRSGRCRGGGLSGRVCVPESRP